MLRELVKKQIIENILRPQNYDSKLGHRKFSVLVLDKSAMVVVNSCLSLNEVFEEGVTLVEDLTRNREPMPSMDAIYIISPVAESIDILINDFSRKTKFNPGNSYRSAHIFFLDPCCDELFEKLSKSPAVKWIKTLKELNLNLKPVESQIFTVNSQFRGDMTKTADGIVSLCATLNIHPTLRFQSDFAQSSEICQRVEQKLKEFGNEGMGTDAELVVLDRSFDLVSPLLHEVTLQAMVVDVTAFKDGVYRYTEAGDSKEIVLDEKDQNWLDLRHKLLPEVMKSVNKMVKDFKNTNKTEPENIKNQSSKDFSTTVRTLQPYLKMKAKMAAYISLTEECRSKYFDSLEKIIALEQDMAVEHTPEHVRITDSQAVGRLSTFILPAIPTETRLRLILIFMLTIGKDKDEQYFNRLLHHTDIPESEFQIIKRMLIWRDKTQKSQFQHRRPPPEDERFIASRWDPKIKNLIEEIYERRLDEREFKVAGKKSTSDFRPAASARYGSGLAGKPREKRKIIIFVVGGITYSEMRVAYELSKKTNTTVILGSDEILTPSSFLESLRDRNTVNC